MNDHPNRIGRRADIKPCLWLYEQGYEVFDNVFTTGPVDLMAYNLVTGEILKIDVKTASVTPSGSINYTKPTEQQKELGVSYLIYLPHRDTFVLLKNPSRAPIADPDLEVL